MKKLTAALLTLIAVLSCALPAYAAEDVTGLNATAKAYVLIEARTGTVIAERGADERLPCANVAMNMGVLVVLRRMSGGTLDPAQKVSVSKNAWGQSGTTVFLDNGETYSAGELLRAVIICSANDAMVALAEHVSGSTEAFVAEMNAEAASMGLSATAFASVTGADAEGQYTSARDAAMIQRELCGFAEYLSAAAVWQEDFTHPSGRVTEMVNYNKLVRFYSGADGGKTGSSGTAGYCIAATAKRGGDRYVYAALGDTSAARFENARAAFDHAFNNYTSKAVVKKGRTVVRDVPVEDGSPATLEGVAAADISLLMTATDAAPDKTAEVQEGLCAPIAAGDKIGVLTVTLDGREVGRCDILAATDVKSADYGSSVLRIIRLWAG